MTITDNEIKEAYKNGFDDGYANPVELSSGLTFDDIELNEAYDEGVNAGQRARAKELGIVAQCDTWNN